MSEHLSVGDRVRVTGMPYEGRVGEVTHVNPDDVNHRLWPVWVHLDGNTHEVGFNVVEVIPA